MTKRTHRIWHDFLSLNLPLIQYIFSNILAEDEDDDDNHNVSDDDVL